MNLYTCLGPLITEIRGIFQEDERILSADALTPCNLGIRGRTPTKSMIDVTEDLFNRGIPFSYLMPTIVAKGRHSS